MSELGISNRLQQGLQPIAESIDTLKENKTKGE